MALINGKIEWNQHNVYIRTNELTDSRIQNYAPIPTHTPAMLENSQPDNQKPKLIIIIKTISWMQYLLY